MVVDTDEYAVVKIYMFELLIQSGRMQQFQFAGRLLYDTGEAR
jgi:hypothetical protein